MVAPFVPYAFIVVVAVCSLLGNGAPNRQGRYEGGIMYLLPPSHLALQSRNDGEASSGGLAGFFNTTKISAALQDIFTQGPLGAAFRPPKEPKMARVDLFTNADPTIRVGTIAFIQYSEVHTMVVIYTFSALNNIPPNGDQRRLEIRTNAAKTTGTGVCLDSALGPVFNPSNTKIGGVISDKVTIASGVGNGNVPAVDPSNLGTLFGPASIIGKSVKIFVAGQDAQAVCGNIVEVK